MPHIRSSNEELTARIIKVERENGVRKLGSVHKCLDDGRRPEGSVLWKTKTKNAIHGKGLEVGGEMRG